MSKPRPIAGTQPRSAMSRYISIAHRYEARAQMSNCVARLLILVLAFSPAGIVPPLSGQASQDAGSTSANDAQWQQDLAAWRAQREHELASPDSWLTLIGLEWLKPGTNSVGAAADNQIRVRAQVPDHIGIFSVSGPLSSLNRKTSKHHHRGASNTHKVSGVQTIQLLAPSGGFPPDLLIDGKPANEGQLTVNDASPSSVSWHGVTMAVLHRGDRYALRIKDADSSTRAAFRGLNWYAPDPHLRVTAKWVPFPPKHIEKIPTVIGTTLNMPSPGIAEFTLNGKALRLEPVVEAGEPGVLFFILRDKTSESTTYRQARFLHTGMPSHGLGRPGHLTLDFNRLENPPCAYTPYASCPLPPEQNRLPVALEAGEKRYTP